MRARALAVAALLRFASDGHFVTGQAVRARMRERYRDRVPLDEPVISPEATLASGRQDVVAEQ